MLMMPMTTKKRSRVIEEVLLQIAASRETEAPGPRSCVRSRTATDCGGGAGRLSPRSHRFPPAQCSNRVICLEVLLREIRCRLRVGETRLQELHQIGFARDRVDFGALGHLNVAEVLLSFAKQLHDCDVDPHALVWLLQTLRSLRAVARHAKDLQVLEGVVLGVPINMVKSDASVRAALATAEVSIDNEFPEFLCRRRGLSVGFALEPRSPNRAWLRRAERRQ